MVYSYNGLLYTVVARETGVQLSYRPPIKCTSYKTIKTVTANLFVLVRPWSQVRVLSYTLRSICSSVGRARIKTVLEKKKEMKLSIIFLLIIFSLICYSVCAIPKSKEEQKRDDEAQLEWIKKHNKANKVRRQVCLKVT